MKKDLISVIVPVYNVEKYLEKCVDSIINQTYKNLEIILVDDGATDNSGKMCDEFAKKDSRIKVIHKENGGLSDARNFGIDVATGKYIQFIDSDDYIDEDMVEVLYKEIIDNEAQISLCSYYILKGEEVTTDATYEKSEYTAEEALKEFLLDKKIRAYAWNKLFLKELFDNIRFPVGRVFEDQLTIPKLFSVAKKIVLNNTPLYYYRQREGSILNKQTKELRLAYINAAFEMYDDLRNRNSNLEKYINYNISHITLNTFNDAGLFKMYDLLNEDVVKKLYNNTKAIFEDIDMQMFIVQNSENVKKIHYYYLLENYETYVENNIYLPPIYPEHKNLVKV